MDNFALVMTRLHLALTALSAPRPRDERGDVPGWVLVTVMSAGIVAAIWGVAEGTLTALLRDALNSVSR
jgi:hypothetical protein